MKTLSILVISILLYTACDDKETAEFDKQTYFENKFKNAELRTIYNYQNERNTSRLIPFLNSSGPENREIAAIALASVQDPAALNELLNCLETDKSEKVKMAVAFAIGQIGDSLAQNQLIKLYLIEKSIPVKVIIAEAIGKCGSYHGLDFLIQQFDNLHNNEQHLNGLLKGVSRFSLRGVFNAHAIESVLKIITDENSSDENLYFASISLSRLKEFNLDGYVDNLIPAFSRSKNVFAKMNIVNAFLRTNSAKACSFLDSIATSNIDYRVRVNAIRAISKFQYSEINELVFKCLSDSNVNVALQASEYLISSGTKADAQKYFLMAKQTINWRVRTNLIAAALKYGDKKVEIVDAIISGYKVATNSYEKANLLQALGGDVASYQFVNQQIDENRGNVVGTAGITALTEMRRNPDFETVAESLRTKKGIDLTKEFSFIFKDAILSGDMAIVAIASEVIRDPDLNFRALYENTYFLTQALNRCILPKEIETYRELQQTIAFIDGKELKENETTQKTKIDWDYIMDIPYNQIINIETSKGNIQVELYVNQAPVSVANYLKLAKKGYFNSKKIHRVVPNFVIQDGCPRGDGWGGPDYSICSEFAMNYFTEGCLGMASAGKDTEASQWFITHSPTPHLDGRYTNFGKVIKGMDIVHQLEVGDEIYRIEVK